MSIQAWVGIGAIILIVAVAIEAFLRRNRPKRSLSEYFGASDDTDEAQKPELGTEEIDMDTFNADMQMNRTLEDRNRKLTRTKSKPKR